MSPPPVMLQAAPVMAGRASTQLACGATRDQAARPAALASLIAQRQAEDDVGGGASAAGISHILHRGPGAGEIRSRQVRQTESGGTMAAGIGHILKPAKHPTKGSTQTALLQPLLTTPHLDRGEAVGGEVLGGQADDEAAPQAHCHAEEHVPAGRAESRGEVGGWLGCTVVWWGWGLISQCWRRWMRCGMCGGSTAKCSTAAAGGAAHQFLTTRSGSSEKMPVNSEGRAQMEMM